MDKSLCEITECDDSLVIPSTQEIENKMGKLIFNTRR